MSPLSWSFKGLAIFWASAFAVSALLLLLARLTQPNAWDLAVPYPNSLRLAWMAFRDAFTVRPFETLALVAIPLLVLAVTLLWLAGLAVRRIA
jgi:hypothetical protein